MLSPHEWSHQLKRAWPFAFPLTLFSLMRTSVQHTSTIFWLFTGSQQRMLTQLIRKPRPKAPGLWMPIINACTTDDLSAKLLTTNHNNRMACKGNPGTHSVKTMMRPFQKLETWWYCPFEGGSSGAWSILIRGDVKQYLRNDFRERKSPFRSNNLYSQQHNQIRNTAAYNAVYIWLHIERNNCWWYMEVQSWQTDNP